ncbi:GNAT family N-acetyltransferase [Hymenobacter caeli]|uniref:GNAT superfamily N-acetyltransferase n=1 Tax=Hymenobacter caeli TaxID=2735894 RepID=A0ABX2FXN6_9BACT|nr:GNAT family N-acetyltransferase [Hymenobacter caeli]NRT21167.1 GNAT superfamily N-acetyltransferase [Hymenobacter caeli]
MPPNLTITPLFNDSSAQIQGLILPIQQIEFNVPITLEGQPDLLDVEAFYHRTGGGFWGAKSADELVGTIGMIATGHHACAIRKMFVKKEYRGKELGIAALLLNTLLIDCRAKGITEVYLSTVDVLKAAHRFYERIGFERRESEEMPAYFPRMPSDNVYYHLHLNA